ncbi:putative amidohydrolase [Pontibacter ummariensis]|uniref:Omega-amidase YafV n=1 Tax=Pontibacter ummariensis TaxID=1610492 RepID=A0A239IIC7_9BACT|nr:amidohydrolase [Pontibacter ummariensis]PRY09857.1 putative amidohydrolase [Pontibacter ummariensis]SNS93162.1 Predicted amidohydrolase [Pontibacter ummariensis]
MHNLNITVVQTALHWQDAVANRSMFSEKLAAAAPTTDLIILPEMFTTGFSMEAEPLAEEAEGPTLTWMQEEARKYQAVLTGSVMVREGGKFFNRLYWVRPDGSFAKYDKRHLFRMAKEHHTYTAGKERLIVELKGWKIHPLVCYDLRFPVWSRNTNNAYDLLLYVANWPKARNQAWRLLLQGRAIENLAYVVGVNRVGTDGNGHPYSGDSAFIHPKGYHLLETSEVEGIHTLKLNKQELENFREAFPAHLDADPFSL